MLGSRSVRSPRTLAAPVPAMPFAAATVALLMLAGCGGEPVDAPPRRPTVRRDLRYGTGPRSCSPPSTRPTRRPRWPATSRRCGPRRSRPRWTSASPQSVRAAYNQRTQPSFQHINPVFAVPPGDPTCFLATATLRLTGSELAPTDVSQFVRGADGQWKLSHNVQVTQPSLVVRPEHRRPAGHGGR